MNFTKLCFLICLLPAFSSCSKDPIIYPNEEEGIVTYEYRDSVVGSYVCNVSWSAWTISSGTSSGFYIDTVIVTKTAFDQWMTDVYTNPFILDSDCLFTADGPNPEARYHGQFFPAIDSVFIYYKNGGMGGQSTYIYTGVKM